MMTAFQLRKQVGDILGIKDDGSWVILDKGSMPDRDLYIVHYTDEGVKTSGHIRGVIVDTKNKKVVCPSLCSTPSVVLDQIPTEGSLSFIDSDDVSHSVNISDSIFIMGFEGFMLRIFKHNGIVYHASNKNLQIDNAKWGDFTMPSFLQIYRDLNGPTDEQLFPPEHGADSPFVYMFIVVHPKLLVGTRQDVGPGYLVQLDTLSIKPHNLTPAVIQLCHDPIPPKVEQAAIYPIRRITVEQANQFLDHGYYPEIGEVADHRLKTGEFVIMICGNRMFRIQSSSYSWRTSLRNNNPIIKHQLIACLLDDAFLVEQESNSSVVKRLKKYYIMFDKDGNINEQPSYTYDERLTLIWMNFCTSLPPQRQSECLPLLQEYLKEREEVINWLISIKDNQSAINDCKNQRVGKILFEARKLSSINKRNVSDVIRNSILHYELNASIYKLIRDCKYYHKKH